MPLLPTLAYKFESFLPQLPIHLSYKFESFRPLFFFSPDRFYSSFPFYLTSTKICCSFCPLLLPPPDRFYASSPLFPTPLSPLSLPFKGGAIFRALGTSLTEPRTTPEVCIIVRLYYTVSLAPPTPHHRKVF